MPPRGAGAVIFLTVRHTGGWSVPEVPFHECYIFSLALPPLAAPPLRERAAPHRPPRPRRLPLRALLAHQARQAPGSPRPLLEVGQAPPQGRENEVALRLPAGRLRLPC